MFVSAAWLLELCVYNIVFYLVFLFIYFLPATIAGKLIKRVMLLVGLGEWKLLNKCHTQYHRYRGATFKVGGGALTSHSKWWG